MISQRKLDGMRRMHAEFLQAFEPAEQGDVDAMTQIAVLGGALAGCVPELLNEIERLSREPERTIVPKLDRFGGSA